jgi:hypothetical protein
LVIGGFKLLYIASFLVIDLHTHTDRSDGSVSPEDLIRKAVDCGLAALAITDHDTLAGYDAAALLVSESGLDLICAVELSTRPAVARNAGRRERSVHVLGYFLSCAPTLEFRNWLETQQESRRRRNVDLIAKLQNLGVQVSLEEAQVYGRNQVGRPHLAQVLCDKKYVSNLQEAFDKYLADDAAAAVDRDEPLLEEGIRRICSAGGLAVLAHPVRLPQKGEELVRLLKHLIENSGLQGIEVIHSEHDRADCEDLLQIAERLDLIPTGGSDFHGENKPSVLLGTGINGNVHLSYEFLVRMREMWHQRATAASGL